jgi:aspartyl-tRNA(Asn)/glutamyl-tRNA(Gln) amidotransferase subunit C
MAKISKEVYPERFSRGDVEHVATLARLELSETEIAKFTEQLGSVLEYFEKLDKAETADIKPIDQINNMENVTTDDKIGEKYEREEMLKNAPEKEDGFIKVKAVFENE